MVSVLKKNYIFTIIVIILLSSIFVIYMKSFSSTNYISLSKKKFPDKIAEWHGKEVPVDEVIYNVLAPDKVIYKEFRNSPNSPSITIFIAGYDTLEKAELSHSPVVCFTGQGWDIQYTKKREMVIDYPDSPRISYNEMVQKKEDITMITVYWYQSANHGFANRGWQKLVLLYDRILGKPDRNAFVRLTSIVPAGSSIDKINNQMKSFVKKFYPTLNNFFL